MRKVELLTLSPQNIELNTKHQGLSFPPGVFIKTLYQNIELDTINTRVLVFTRVSTFLRPSLNSAMLIL